MARFLDPMVVDIRPVEGSANYYFYQHHTGQLIFCMTPDPPIVGTDRRETSAFLPMVSRRMIEVMPRLRHIKVRRTWRGLYPMTPDGAPLVGWNQEVKGLLHVSGMCGQGLMLAPGVAELASRMVTEQTTEEDEIIIEEFSPYREFKGDEALK